MDEEIVELLIFNKIPAEEIRQRLDWSRHDIRTRIFNGFMELGLEQRPYVESVILMLYEELSKRINWSEFNIFTHTYTILNLSKLGVYVNDFFIEKVYEIIGHHIPTSHTPAAELSEMIKQSWKYPSLHLIQWCYDYSVRHKIPFYVKPEIIDRCTELNILDWWKDTFQPVDYTTNMDNWKGIIKIDLVKWWVDNGFSIDPGVSIRTWEIIRDEIVMFLHDAGLRMKINQFRTRFFYVTTHNHNMPGDLEKMMDWFFEMYPSELATILDDASFVAKLYVCASGYKILKYFTENDIPFNHTGVYMDSLTDIYAAHFWENSGLPLRATSHGLILVLQRDIAMGEWWIKMDLPVASSYDLNLVHISQAPVLAKFFLKHEIEFTYTENLLDSIGKIGSIFYNYLGDLINAWISTGMELKYTHIFIDRCINLGILEPLEHILKKDMPFPYTQAALDGIGTSGDAACVIRWWFDHDLEPKYGHSFVETISMLGIEKEVSALFETHGYELLLGS